MSEQDTQRLFSSYINAIMERCAEEAGVSVDVLRRAYVEDRLTRDILNQIFQRHIDSLDAA